MDFQTFQIKEEKDYTPSDLRADIYEKEWFRYIESTDGEFYIKKSPPLYKQKERDYTTSDSKIISKEGDVFLIKLTDGESYIEELPSIIIDQPYYEEVYVYRTDINYTADEVIFYDILRKYSRAWKRLAEM